MVMAIIAKGKVCQVCFTLINAFSLHFIFGVAMHVPPCCYYIIHGESAALIMCFGATSQRGSPGLSTRTIWL